MDEAIRLSPTNSEYYGARGGFKKENGNYDAAIIDFDKAIELYQQEMVELNPNEIKEAKETSELIQNKICKLNLFAGAIYINRLSVNMLKEDIDGAIADATQAIHFDPTCFSAHYCLGILKQKREDHDGAIIEFDKAARLSPGCQPVYHARGKSKFQKGDYEGAKADHGIAVDISGNNYMDSNVPSDWLLKNRPLHYPNDYLNPKQKLWAAAQEGDIDGIKALRDSVNFDAQDEKGYTALHYAAVGGQVKVVIFLYVNYDTADKAGETPIQVAARYKKNDMVKELLDREVKLEGVLHTMVVAGHKDSLEHFLTIPSHYRDRLLSACPGGVRALIRTAIQAQKPEILRFLIQYEPGCRNKLYEGQGLFHEALMVGNEDVMNVLFEQYVDPTQLNKFEQTPAQLAVNPDESNPNPTRSLSKLVIQLTHFSNVRKTQNENLTRNINTTINSLRKQLSNETDWNFLLKEKGERRNLFERIVREYLSTDLYCQKLLSTPNPNTSTLIATLKRSISQAQPKLFKTTPLKSQLLEVPLRQVVEEAIRILDPSDEKRSTGTGAAKESNITSSHLPAVSESKEPQEPRLQSLTREQEEFVNEFEREFDDAYCQFSALRKGAVIHVPDSKDHVAQLAKNVADALPNVSMGVPLVPGVSIAIPTGKVVGAAIDVGMYFRNRWRGEKAGRMCNLFAGCTPLERQQIIHLAATCIAEKYRFQLAHLQSGSEGVSRFAACAAQRVIDYIISADNHQIQQEATNIDRIGRWLQSCWSGAEIPSKLKVKKSLLSIFLDGMLRVTDYPGDNTPLRTRNGLTFTDQWTSKGVIENTGVLTPTGERFAHQNCLVDSYGYVYGTEEEAERRGLKDLDPKTQQPWSLGRSWELSPRRNEPSAPSVGSAATSPLVAAMQSGMTFINDGRSSSSSSCSNPQTQYSW